MVRLKASYETRREPCVQFQFQYGTIERSQKQAATQMQGNFNSSMVRLKEEQAKKDIKQKDISIPVWYD